MECSYADGFADSTRAELLPLKGEQKMLSLRVNLLELSFAPAKPAL
jgi:hypothetical protein